MLLLKKIYCLLLLLFLVASVNGQSQFKCRIYKHDNGLAGRKVTSIVQDRDGFIWVGTEEGLNRFDGYQFQVYRHIVGDKSSLYDNSVKDLTIDSNDNLWIVTSKGIQTYDVEKEKICQKGDQFGKVIDIQAHQKRLWVSNRNGIKCYRIDTVGMPQVYENKQLGGGTFFRQDNKLYYNSNRKILELSIDGTKEVGSIPAQFNPIAFNSKSRLAFGCAVGQILDGVNQKSGGGNVSGFVVDRKCIWYSTTDNEILRYDLESKTLNSLDLAWDNNLFSRRHNLTIEFVDNAGSIWGTITGIGLIQIWEEPKVFEHVEQFGENGLADKWVRSICCDKNGIIWIGGNKGLDCLDDNCWQRFDKDQLTSSMITWVAVDRDNNKWVATDNGVSVIDPQLNIDVVYLPGGNHQTINQIFVDRENVVWMLAPSGTIFKSKDVAQQLSLEKYSNGLINTHNDNSNYRVIHVDRNHNLWFGGLGVGLTKINLKSKQQRSFWNRKKGKQPRSVYSLTEDSDGNIYIATNKGLSIWNESQQRMRRLTTDDGLVSDVIYGVQADNNGNVWVGTDRGLNRYNIADDNFTDFLFDGTYDVNVYTKAVHNSIENDVIYLGTNHGFLHFESRALYRDSLKNGLKLTHFNVNNVSIVDAEKNGKGEKTMFKLGFDEEITLAHDENNISIGFVVPNFKTPKRVSYEYRLYPVQKRWQQTDFDKAEVNYNQLDWGDYRFDIRSISTDGVKSDQINSLEIRIKKPVWLTPFAFVIYLFVFGGLCFFGFRLITYRSRMKHQLLIEKIERKKNEELLQMKMQFFTNISHELRTPLTLILGPLEDAIDNKGTVDKLLLMPVVKQAKHLQQLVDQLLDFRKAEMNEMKPYLVPTDLNQFLQEVYKAFIWRTSEKQIEFILSIDDQQLQCMIDTDFLEKILYNLLSNAIKYTPDNGTIELSLKRESGWLKLSVSDTGMGVREEEIAKIFKPYYQTENAKPGTGIGLSLVKELVDLLGGKIEVVSEPECGTTFEIYLPFIEKMKVVKSDCDENEKRSGTILIVEDNCDVLKYIADGLSPFFNISTAFDGEEALRMAQLEQYDAIVSDVMMPRMDGCELARRLKSDITTSHIPIILLTALSDIEEKIKGIETGVDAYITKPFNMTYLHKRIERLIDSRRLILGKKRLEEEDVDEVALELSVPDQNFMQKLEELINDELNNSNLDIQFLIERLAVSRSLFHVKMKKLYGQTPGDLIREKRIDRAKKLILEGYTISEVAYSVGYNDAKYFSSSFKKQVGVTPTKYRSDHKRG